MFGYYENLLLSTVMMIFFFWWYLNGKEPKYRNGAEGKSDLNSKNLT